MAPPFALDPPAPRVRNRRLVCTRSAQRPIGAETNIVQSVHRISCRLSQPERKWIAKTHERSRAVGWIDSDHICVLIESCAAVGNDTSDPRSRLPVVDAVASAHHHVWTKLIGEAEARLNVMP